MGEIWYALPLRQATAHLAARRRKEKTMTFYSLSFFSCEWKRKNKRRSKGGAEFFFVFRFAWVVEKNQKYFFFFLLLCESVWMKF